MILDNLKTATLWLASGTEAVAALIISSAVIEGAIRALAIFFISEPGVGGNHQQDAKEACPA